MCINILSFILHAQITMVNEYYNDDQLQYSQADEIKLVSVSVCYVCKLI